MEDRVARAMERARPLQLLTDEDVAAQLRHEARKKQERTKEHGVMSYLLPSAPTQNINKGFLLNTIRSVDSHNRRQEIDECYRKRDLEVKVRSRRSRSRSQSRGRRRRSASPVRRKPRSPSPTRDADERAFWAERKAARTAELLSALGDRVCTLENAPNYDESSSDYEDERDETRAAKKLRKAAKKAKKAAKKAKKAAKKAKRLEA
ncbi:hypothetical protein ACHHYP_07310 [Achlya hypogyna]|uniref:Uncharacterized protein n=1 Tax=Achlya hypogyna TaxID=1202772 RepID=A0A1V9YR52_ACHHY|nr:hypothetical protein ACHHYP_07310 [Achlya hypogyna]